MAAVIASQAVISGAFSMTKQAIQLGFLPRMQVVYTSAREAGQIYLPRVNWVAAGGRDLAVVGFGSVVGAGLGLRHRGDRDDADRHHAHLLRRALRLGPAALARAGRAPASSSRSTRCWWPSCSLKFMQGGWFPLLLGAGDVRGDVDVEARPRAADRIASAATTPTCCRSSQRWPSDDIMRAPRTAVFTVANAGTVPQALMHNLKHNQRAARDNVILIGDVPRGAVDPVRRARAWSSRWRAASGASASTTASRTRPTSRRR